MLMSLAGADYARAPKKCSRVKSSSCSQQGILTFSSRSQSRRADLLPIRTDMNVPEMLLADIKASDQAVLNLENMACLRIEQRIPVQIARGQMNLDVGCSILADRKAGWLRACVHHRPLSRPVVADAVVPVEMPAFQPVGPR